MSLIPLLTPQRYTNTKEIGKSKNTGLIFNLLQKIDNLHAKQYFNDPSNFLSTSTAGYAVSTFDVSDDLVSDDFSPAYISKPVKPALLDFTRPYNLAGSANAQVDFPFTADLIQNDTIRLVIYSNYAAATFSLTLASDNAYANKIVFTGTGSSTLYNGRYRTVVNFKVSQGTQTSNPILDKIIRGRIIGINSTTTNKIAPVALYVANNTSMFPGSLISFKACCVDEPSLSRELTKAALKCGRATVGEVATDDKFTLGFSIIEESPDLIALSVGSYNQILNIDVFEHIAGYDPGQISNTIVGDSGTPTYGSVTLAPNLRIQSVVIDCGNLQSVEFDSTIAANVNLVLGRGQYSYDPTTGIMYFNTGNIGQNPEITKYVNKALNAVLPEPNKLGHYTSAILQDAATGGKVRYYILNKLQFAFPTASLDDQGTKQTFSLSVFFSQRGDVIQAYDI